MAFLTSYIKKPSAGAGGKSTQHPNVKQSRYTETLYRQPRHTRTDTRKTRVFALQQICPNTKVRIPEAKVGLSVSELLSFFFFSFLFCVVQMNQGIGDKIAVDLVQDNQGFGVRFAVDLVQGNQTWQSLWESVKRTTFWHTHARGLVRPYISRGFY